MVSSVRAASRFALVVALKAVLIGALVFAAFLVLSREQYYATALVLLCLAALVALSLIRTARSADRLYADFVNAVGAGAFDTASASLPMLPSFTDALRRASDRLAQDRQIKMQRIQALESLLDTLSAVLFAVREDGELLLANRAALALAGEETKRLADIAAIGPATAERLIQLAVGAREIVQLADGRRMLASIAMFRGAEGVPQRLISLQSLSGELSAVETLAWQDLVRVLSHEMMNSLTPVVSLSDSLQRLLAIPGRPIPEEASTAADIIARRSAGLMRFVERYRRVAELPEPRMKTLAMADLLRDIAPLAAEYAGGRTISYHTEVSPADLTVYADPDLLSQAMINLVKNAVESATAVPEPQIRVICRATDHQILIEVRDNGAGLPQHEPEQIFTPFLTTKSDGSGVGLALARQIAIAHGGELTASRLPQGAEFKLGFPLRSVVR
jgi:nitrogen fixation/metabolism regulation signal transduction histidine kinase